MRDSMADARAGLARPLGRAATCRAARSWRESRWIRPFGQRVLHSEFWRFTRRSVPRGVAIGLFVGIFFLIPGVQIIGAALLCCRSAATSRSPRR